MPRAFVAAHGGYNPVEPNSDNPQTTRVPFGKELTVHSGLDQDSLIKIMLGRASIDDFVPEHVYEAGRKVPNYIMLPFEDELVEMYADSQNSRTHGTFYSVGKDSLTNSSGRIRLCSSPTKCIDQIDSTGDHHAPRCRGLFNRLAENRIYLLFSGN